MTTYGIYFENNYGEAQDYAFFSEEPKVNSNTGDPKVYSNVFLSQRVVNRGTWTVNITESFYAWCGTVAEKLGPNVNVATGVGQLASLGTSDSKGSTWTMYNDEGTPAFYDTPDYTANASSFEIDTGEDFSPADNFVIGLGGVDQNGMMKPLATFSAPRNANVNIAPVTVFYIGAFSSSVGNVIDKTMVSKKCAVIDFTKHPGMFGAIVKQADNGKFDVKYLPRLTSTMQVSNYNGRIQLEQWIVAQLQKYIQLLQNVLDEDDNVAKANPVHYNFLLSWVGNPSKGQKVEVLSQLIKNMVGYSYEDGDLEEHLFADFSHPLPSTYERAIDDWTEAVHTLPNELKMYTVDPHVEPITSVANPEQTDGHANGTTQEAKDALLDVNQRARKLLEAERLPRSALNGTSV